jgi:hypothetical protein
VILVDDHLLAARFSEVADQRTAPIPLATTTCWWWRLTAALAGGRAGALSRLLGDVDDPLEAIGGLADAVRVLDLRALLPMMGGFASAFRLNLPAAEALAAAEVLGADIVVGRDAPRLRQAARVRGVTYLVEA